MDIVLFAAIVSGECTGDYYCVYHEYMFAPPTSGVQVVRKYNPVEYFVFSGRKSSSEYMKGLNIYTGDTI